MAEAIPERLLRTDLEGEFLAWLRDLRLSPEDKRLLLMAWADRVELKPTADMINRAGIE
jgi:hypothetical protein